MYLSRGHAGLVMYEEEGVTSNSGDAPALRTIFSGEEEGVISNAGDAPALDTILGHCRLGG